MNAATRSQGAIDVGRSVRWLSFRIVGSSADQLRAAIALAGPRRNGRVYPAFTDWELSWSALPQSRNGGWLVRAPRVALEATVTLPEWRPPRNASAALVEWWADNLEALRRHEQGHLALAEEAAATVLAALEALPPENCEEQLRTSANDTASKTLAAMRQRQCAYDAATGYGRLQGVQLDLPEIPRSDVLSEVTA